MARVLARGLALAAVLWLAGFAWFVWLATRPAPPRAHAQGIVALTGGADRVRTALHLLAAGDAARLLVSGIGGGADLADLGRRAGFDPAPLAPRITLGRGAGSTFGNAEEAAAWVQAAHLKSLILVTAFYHMPRAEIEFRRALPQVRLVPWPVHPPGMRRLDGLGSWAGLRLMGEEYAKFVFAGLGLSALFPGPPPRLTPATLEAGKARAAATAAGPG
ncbi:MAG: YdcF family protein [Rhodospirillales bacterium]|nr:YdcF family protein [Rhodospirillales bacterium]